MGQPVQNSMKRGKWLNTSCKMCLFCCNIRVLVSDDGVLLKVEGDPSSPANGSRLCPKGNAAILRHYDPNRFKTPLKRTNPEKGPGIDPRWVPVSWDEAFDIVSRELQRVRQDDPRKLLPAITDFHKGWLMGWPAVFGTRNFFSSWSNYCGPQGYFVRGSEGKVCVWDPVENSPKAWDDATIRDFALEGEYRVNGVPCKPGFQLFKDILQRCTPEEMPSRRFREGRR